MGAVGAPELIIVLVIVLLLFGGKKLPELSRSMGKSIREFRKGTEESDAEDEGTHSGTGAAAGDEATRSEADASS